MRTARSRQVDSQVARIRRFDGALARAMLVAWVAIAVLMAVSIAVLVA